MKHFTDRVRIDGQMIEITIAIDMPKLMMILAKRAWKNKTKRTVMIKGIIVASVRHIERTKR